jgi:hypothetical protein
MKNEKPSLSMPYNFMLILFYKGRKNFAFHNKKSFLYKKNSRTANCDSAIFLGECADIIHCLPTVYSPAKVFPKLSLLISCITGAVLASEVVVSILPIKNLSPSTL